MPSVALATCKELPHLDSDEASLVRALEARGVSPVILPWDGGDAGFLGCACTVIRSTWDYTARVEEFVAWAARIEESSRIYNRASVVRWNTHKGYLLELAHEGINIVPTVLVEKGKAANLRKILAEQGWMFGSVVKPAVSAGSKDTVRVRGLDTAEGQALLDAHAPTRDMLVQPYVNGVKEGEISLIYVDGAYSHAVNKRPKADDFRSQPEFGSKVERAEPTAEQRAAADATLEVVGGGLLYARLDFVRGDDGDPWLMELELVEPSLYLAWDERAADRVADAILKRL